MTLYELTGEYRALMEMAEDENVDPDVLSDTLEAVDGEIEDKADAYGKIIKSLEGDIASVNSELERLTKKKKTVQKKIDALKKNLEDSMKAMKKTKIKTALFSFWIQKNRPTVDFQPGEEVPEDFLIQHEPTIDQKAALDFLEKNGDQVWGKKKQTESLRIR